MCKPIRSRVSLLAVGWAGCATVCLIQIVLIAAMGVAWWVLLPGTKIWIAIWGRFVRDAGSEVLPLFEIISVVSPAA